MQTRKRLDIHFSLPIWWPGKAINWRAWLPSRGSVLFTLIIVGGLLWAQGAGALTLGAPLAATTSTGTIAYQGRLANASGNPLTGTYNMSFRLYNASSGGTPLWTNSGQGPTAFR